MKKFNPGRANLFAYCVRAVILSLIMLVSAFLISASGQSLNFENPILQSGAAGQDGAVYRFSSVAPNVDATLKIKKRSSSLVTLDDIDVSNFGWDKAFQPQIGYNGGIVTGAKDWWMEFEMNFMKEGTNDPASVTSFSLTALDVDGDGYMVREYMDLKGAQSYAFESGTQLTITSANEDDSGGNGYTFLGPITNYLNIDTSATQVMVTCKYYSKNKIKFTIGAKSTGTGTSNASSRYNSIWFKTFSYLAPKFLPFTLTDFRVNYENKKARLNWVALEEKNSSHYVIQRSTDGSDFNDVAIIFSSENRSAKHEYSYSDQLKTTTNGVLWYRLKMVDIDGKFEYSPLRLIRTGEERKLALLTYPNPAVNQIQIAIPSNWQDKKLTYAIYNGNGHLLMEQVSPRAGQTATMQITNLEAGLYFIKVSTTTTSLMQPFVKAR